MKITPTVSVIMTSFNYGDYIKEAIDSVLNQTVVPKEVIVIDDGSTDGSRDVLSHYENNSLVQVVYQDNAGQANAKNKGIKLAKGDLVAFLDADDVWEPTKLEKQVPLFIDCRVGLVFSRQRFIDAEGQSWTPQPNRLPVFRGFVTGPLLKDNFLPFSSVVVRRSLLEEKGIFNESLPMGIDWDLWLRLSTETKFDYVDENLLLYRQGHSGQMSKKVELRQACADRIFHEFLKKYQQDLRQTDVQDAKVYTFNQRGYAWRGKKPWLSFKYYAKSLWMRPFQVAAYKGILMAPFK